MEAILRKIKLDIVEEILRKTIAIRKLAGGNEEILANTEVILKNLSMLSKILTHIEQEIAKLKHLREELEEIKLEAEHEEKLATEAEEETAKLIDEDIDTSIS